MSKDLEMLKADVKKLMLKDWTETEVTKLDEFMEDVIIATMVVNKLPIHVVVVPKGTLCCVCETKKANTGYDLKFCKECWEEED
tara:strand:+ start:428 stop:679 length:252 start_codon:yes stop_codon:yes gene_type:complete